MRRCCGRRAGSSRGSCWTWPRRRMRQPAGSSTSTRPSSCSRSCSRSCKIPVLRKTPTGQPSTAEDVLEELAADYELPRLILEYRGLAKLKSTYTDKLPEQINARDRPRAHQLPPGGGRDRPPVLDRPEPAEHPDPHARGPAHPPGLHRAARLRADGGGLLADRAAHHGAPVRRRGPAARLRRRTGTSTRPPPPRSSACRRSRSTAEQRRSAKAINFGLIYGMSAFGLARQLGIDRRCGTALRGSLLQALPGREALHGRHPRAGTRERATSRPCAGRRLYLPEIRSRNRQLQQYAERSAINAPMQGTAADIIKQAMISVEAALHRRGPAGAPDHAGARRAGAGGARRRRGAGRGRWCASRWWRPAALRVPLKVQIGIGANWDEAH